MLTLGMYSAAPEVAPAETVPVVYTVDSTSTGGQSQEQDTTTGEQEDSTPED